MPVPRARKVPETLAGLAATGDRRATLEALRNFLAAQLENSERDIPALAKQLRDTIAELDALPNPKETSRVDELNARRAARRSKAAG